jgi:hypothetical protein
MTSISRSGPSVMARQKSHRAASSARPGSRSVRTADVAAGIESLLRASRATSGGETSTSSGLRGSSTARTVTTRRFSDFASLEASLESVIAASAFRPSCALPEAQRRGSSLRRVRTSHGYALRRSRGPCIRRRSRYARLRPTKRVSSRTTRSKSSWPAQRAGLRSGVRARGLEPPRALAHRVLNPARLPVPPHPLGLNQGADPAAPTKY